eukprot:m.515041 g.515041  ORF g.515041 m.515041 type:complete len:274 (+) comp57459_c0_seq8:2644-3465(+)
MPPKVDSKGKALLGINIFYLIVGIILIAVAGVAKGQATISTISIIGGVIAAGVFLLLIAILGIIATFKMKRGVIFAYLVLLILLFVIHFAVSIAVLAFNSPEQQQLVEDGWCGLASLDKIQIQNKYNCFGLFDGDVAQNPSYYNATKGSFKACMMPGRSCLTTCSLPNPTWCSPLPVTTVAPKTTTITSTTTSTTTTTTTTTVTTTTLSTTANSLARCRGCYDKLKSQITQAIKIAGGVGLAFCFTELIGVIIAWRLWKQNKDAAGSNYRAFL